MCHLQRLPPVSADAARPQTSCCPSFFPVRDSSKEGPSPRITLGDKAGPADRGGSVQLRSPTSLVQEAAEVLLPLGEASGRSDIGQFPNTSAPSLKSIALPPSGLRLPVVCPWRGWGCAPPPTIHRLSTGLATNSAFFFPSFASAALARSSHSVVLMNELAKCM